MVVTARVPRTPTSHWICLAVRLPAEDDMSSQTRGPWLSVPWSPMVWFFQTDTTTIARYSYVVKLNVRQTIIIVTRET